LYIKIEGRNKHQVQLLFQRDDFDQTHQQEIQLHQQLENNLSRHDELNQLKIKILFIRKKTKHNYLEHDHLNQML
jgi:hypothetical protein